MFAIAFRSSRSRSSSATRSRSSSSSARRVASRRAIGGAYAGRRDASRGVPEHGARKGPVEERATDDGRLAACGRDGGEVRRGRDPAGGDDGQAGRGDDTAEDLRVRARERPVALDGGAMETGDAGAGAPLGRGLGTLAGALGRPVHGDAAVADIEGDHEPVGERIGEAPPAPAPSMPQSDEDTGSAGVEECLRVGDGADAAARLDARGRGRFGQACEERRGERPAARAVKVDDVEECRAGAREVCDDERPGRRDGAYVLVVPAAQPHRLTTEDVDSRDHADHADMLTC